MSKDRRNGKPARIAVSAYLDPALFRKLDRRVKSDGHTSQSQMVARLIERALEEESKPDAQLATA